MIKISEACIFTDFILELMDRAGGIDWLDTPTTRTNQIVAVFVGQNQREVRGPFVQAEAADESVLGEALEQPENRRLIALI